MPIRISAPDGVYLRNAGAMRIEVGLFRGLSGITDVALSRRAVEKT